MTTASSAHRWASTLVPTHHYIAFSQNLDRCRLGSYASMSAHSASTPTAQSVGTASVATVALFQWITSSTVRPHCVPRILCLVKLRRSINRQSKPKNALFSECVSEASRNRVFVLKATLERNRSLVKRWPAFKRVHTSWAMHRIRLFIFETAAVVWVHLATDQTHSVCVCVVLRASTQMTICTARFTLIQTVLTEKYSYSGTSHQTTLIHSKSSRRFVVSY